MSANTKAKSKHNVEEKYGIKKTNAVMLFIQMILVVIGLVNACLSVYDGVMSGLGMMFMFSQRLKDRKFAKGCMNAVCVLQK